MSVNGQAVEDQLDFYFHAADCFLCFRVEGRESSSRKELVLERTPGRALGLTVEQSPVRRCRNRCIFCFVDQLPRGLRRSLYVKDEDYRHSFLYGNFITGGNLCDADVERIVRMRLSPLYVSVHATDPQVRGRLMGGCAPADVMPLLGRLTSAGIAIHGQVVLCPGINDGPVLERTVVDFAGLGENARSLAVVPVGLSSHRRKLDWIEPVSGGLARSTIRLINRWQRRFLAERGSRLVFAADELYLRAGARLPSAASYEDYPQIENGVGLVRHSIEAVKALLPRINGLPAVNGIRIGIVTGRLFAPVIKHRIIPLLPDRLAGSIGIIEVTNRLLGESISVAGLLAGGDILAAIRGRTRADVYLLPSASLNENGRFLDDYTLRQMQEELSPARVVVAEQLATGIVSAAGVAAVNI